MKPNNIEIKFLIDYEKNYNIKEINNPNDNYIEIPQNIAQYFQSRIKIKPVLDERALKIQNLRNNHKNKKVSCRALAELYRKTYNHKISRTTINLILKNQLGLKFHKQYKK